MEEAEDEPQVADRVEGPGDARGCAVTGSGPVPAEPSALARLRRMKRWLGGKSRWIYLLVVVRLVVEQVITFVDYQSVDSERFPRGLNRVYVPLVRHEEGSPPPLWWARVALRYYPALQKYVMGTELVVPANMKLSVWSWEHLALATLRFDDVKRVVPEVDRELLRGTPREMFRLGDRRVFFFDPPEKIRGRLAYLVNDPETADIYVVAPGRLGTPAVGEPN